MQFEISTDTRRAMAKGTFRFLPAKAIAQLLEPIPTDGMTLKDIATLKQMARERIESGRRVLAAELGIPIDAAPAVVDSDE